MPTQSVIIEPGCDLSNRRLINVNLSGLNLSGANFRHSCLRGASFVDANVSGADFRNANLANAKFIRADLQKANFKRAYLAMADLGNAYIKETSFHRSFLTQAYFGGCNLEHAIDIINAGCDNRGYRFLATPAGNSKRVHIFAGCRFFRDIQDAKYHWNTRHLDIPKLREQCLEKVDYIEAEAKRLGWIN